MQRVLRASDRQVIAERCLMANTIMTRIIGLLRHESLSESEALWIAPCNSIHTFFMRFAIDAVFLDREHRVIRIYQNLKPWRATWTHFFAKSVLELPSGAVRAKGLELGQQLVFESI